MQTKIGCVKSFAVKCAHKCNFLRINATFVENKCNFLTFLLQQKLALVISFEMDRRYLFLNLDKVNDAPLLVELRKTENRNKALPYFWKQHWFCRISQNAVSVWT